jgi:hypothetical protein
LATHFDCHFKHGGHEIGRLREASVRILAPVVRRKDKYVSQTFRWKEDAKAWAIDAERSIDKGNTPTPARARRLQTFGDLIDLHIADMTQVGKPPGRAKATTLAMLRRELGAVKMAAMDRDRLVRLGRNAPGKAPGP